MPSTSSSNGALPRKAHDTLPWTEPRVESLRSTWRRPNHTDSTELRRASQLRKRLLPWNLVEYRVARARLVLRMKSSRRSLPGLRVASAGDTVQPSVDPRASSQPQYELSCQLSRPNPNLFLPFSQFSNSQTRPSSPFSLTSPQTRGLPSTIHGSGFGVAWRPVITIGSGYSFYDR